MPTSISTDSLKHYADFAHRLADAAGDVLRKAFKTGGAVEEKSDKSPVTTADKEAEAVMRALIKATWPEHGIIGEEYGNENPSAPFQWVLDPIDGTRAFIAGHTTFTTLIALAHQGVPVLGIIDQPVTKERWLGIKSHPTTKTGERVSVRNTLLLSHATLATTSTDYFTPEQAKAFARLKDKCGEVTYGGDAYLYAQLASGEMDLVIDAGLKPYDFCALAPVVEGAGGIITDWVGAPIGLFSNGQVIAAASRQIHIPALAACLPTEK